MENCAKIKELRNGGINIFCFIDESMDKNFTQPIAESDWSSSLSAPSSTPTPGVVTFNNQFPHELIIWSELQIVSLFSFT